MMKMTNDSMLFLKKIETTKSCENKFEIRSYVDKNVYEKFKILHPLNYSQDIEL